MITKRGYDVWELLSALQKDIRRGNEGQALFWAVELESFNPHTLWKRLEVIASEDIGVANPVIPIVVDVLEDQYFEGKKRDEKKKRRKYDFRIFLANAIVILSRSQHSRIAVDLLNVVYSEIQHENKMLPIPDYALDRHTRRGRRMGRVGKEGWEHFFSEGTKQSNEAFPNPYTERAKEILMKYGDLASEFKRKK